ncbi:Uncharacterised protein [Chlamydia trachomatis]|nr:Uncharacterised protein [Chlamydia trachomatis]
MLYQIDIEVLSLGMSQGITDNFLTNAEQMLFYQLGQMVNFMMEGNLNSAFITNFLQNHFESLYQIFSC